jgi:hypothetical protein
VVLDLFVPAVAKNKRIINTIFSRNENLLKIVLAGVVTELAGVVTELAGVVGETPAGRKNMFTRNKFEKIYYLLLLDKNNLPGATQPTTITRTAVGSALPVVFKI